MVRAMILLSFLLACLMGPGLPIGMAAEVGKSAAMKYFTTEAKEQKSTRGPASSSSLAGDRILAFSFGSLIQSKSYDWAGDAIPGWNVEAFYQWAQSGVFGKGIHLELQKFAVQEEELTKLSVLYSLTFPRRLSFPVYLGVAFGPGYFLKQREGESEFAFDYKTYLGLRLHQQNAQYFVQSGVKNHVHVLSDGQFIGWFVSSGVAYTF